MPLTRRRFIKGGLAAACAACTLKTPLPASAMPKDKRELATLIDIRKCIACEACVEACRDDNAAKYPKPAKPFPQMYPARVKVEDWSSEEKREVRDRLTPYNWLSIQTATVEIDGQEAELNIPRRCMHCRNPPCADLCPWGASRKLKNGITLIDADICMGGSKCKAVCPWHIPQRQTGVGLYLNLLPALAGNGVMYKCDRCYNRIAQGELPACIRECPEDVQTIGPRDEIVSRAHRLAEEDGLYIYGETENGGTNTLYLSPIPFDALSQAMEPGAGKPHMNPVKDQMAHADNLTKALLIAPVAGLAAAMGRVYTAMRPHKNKQEPAS